MAFVLDASLALAWCFKDQATAASSELLARAQANETIFVPAHWPAEILNALSRAVRRGRIEDATADVFLQLLPAFDIVVDEYPIASWWTETIEITRTYPLSGYDAAYLALALRLHVPLASTDEQLRIAAVIAGVTLIPHSSQ